MNSLSRDFISEEQREYRFKVGRTIGSALAGFVVGVICASIIWALGIDYLSELFSSLSR